MALFSDDFDALVQCEMWRADIQEEIDTYVEHVANLRQSQNLLFEMRERNMTALTWTQIKSGYASAIEHYEKKIERLRNALK